jgi:hypothetical protein
MAVVGTGAGDDDDVGGHAGFGVGAIGAVEHGVAHGGGNPI